MLNELYELSRSLEHHNLLKSCTNPNINSVGACDCILIELDGDGVPRGVRYIIPSLTKNLWKHSRSKHHSFPAIRVQKPLLAAAVSELFPEEKWSRAKLTEKVMILSKLDFLNLNPDCKDIKISDWSVKQLEPVVGSTLPELAALRQLLSVFPPEKQANAFARHLLRLIQKSLLTFSDEALLNMLKELLVGHWDNKTKKYVSGCMTYYDVYETSMYCNLVASAATQTALTQFLNSMDSIMPHEKQIVSPLSGNTESGVGEKYPEPKLPIIGSTFIFSKKYDTPCLCRYGVAGADAFQAAKSEVNAINDALAFLTADFRWGKTWRAMSDCARDKPNLLLAYLPDDPQNDACLAQLLSDPSDYEDAEEFRMEAESAYVALCGQVLGSMEEVIRKNANAKVNLILLEALDTGRKQVAYESTLTAQRLCTNMQIWSEAFQNAPPVEIRVSHKKEILSYVPSCPGPNDICQLLKTNYTRSGVSKPGKSSAVALPEIYRVYMPSDLEFTERLGSIEHMLAQTLQRGRIFLGDIGGVMIADYALPQGKKSQTQAKQAAKFISLLAILLWMLNIRKENYMLDVPYNVGQFLKLADMLHKEYCIQVRNGGDKKKALPSQLMGNEMLTIASEDPVEGINRLRDRMKIYLAWASTITGENVGLAKWILARFEEVSAKIATKELPKQFSAPEQAQVLLGYLAAIPYDKENK